MQNIPLQLDSGGIQSTLNNTVTSLIEQITPELPHTSFVTDLAFIMIIGAVVTLAFFKIKQPLIIGYLFAGMLIGPFSSIWTWILPKGGLPIDAIGGVGILSDISALNLFAEIGVILLLFVIGIEFPYAKIKSIGRVAVGSWNYRIIFNIRCIVLYCYCAWIRIHGCTVYFCSLVCV